MSTVLLPGSFDPPTLGHQDIILRAARVAKKLFVGVAHNARKQDYTFTVPERIELLKEILKGQSNIEVIAIDGLVVEFAKKHQIDFFIRGLRPFANMTTEYQMALANKQIGGIDTLYILSDGKFGHISSSLIREIASYGHHLKDFVPASIEPIVCERLRA